MVSRKVIVQNEKGIHLRTAGIFCEEAMKYKAHVDLKCKNKTLNGKSVLGVLGAGVKRNDTIEIVCDGEDEERALDSLIALVQNGLGEK